MLKESVKARADLMNQELQKACERGTLYGKEGEPLLGTGLSSDSPVEN
jgi:hypothetical protein